MASAEQVTTENATSEELAQLNEEMRARVQMQDIERSTVEPGKIMVPVKAVATSDDNERVALRVEHPIDGEVTFHLSKPRTWDPSNELVQFLTWYGLSINGIYELQTHDVCIEEDDSVKGWRLSEPPGYTPPRRERLRSRVPPLPEVIHVAVFSGILGLVALVGVIGALVQYRYPETTAGTAAASGLIVGMMGALVVLAIALVFGEVRDD